MSDDGECESQLTQNQYRINTESIQNHKIQRHKYSINTNLSQIDLDHRFNHGFNHGFNCNSNHDFLAIADQPNQTRLKTLPSKAFSFLRVRILRELRGNLAIQLI